MKTRGWFRVLVLLVFAQRGSASPIPPPNGCVACKVEFANERAELTDDEWTRAEKGEIVTGRHDLPVAPGTAATQTEVRSAAVFNHPPERVWEVLTDFDGRPKYLSDLKKLEITRNEGNRYWMYELIGVFFTSIEYTVINTVEADRGRVAWELDTTAPHDIASTKGAWQISRLPDSDRTLLRYRCTLDTGKPVPKFIESALSERSLPGLIGSIRGEVDRRYPAQKQASAR